jgi:thioredoxin-like negative regulator of GroEL
MYTPVKTLEQYNDLLRKEQALLFYFSTDECQVCKVIKPKIEKLLSANFPKIKLFYINLNTSPELSAQNRIFAVPTIQLVFGGREYFRKSRSFSLAELEDEIARPYRLMFT